MTTTVTDLHPREAMMLLRQDHDLPDINRLALLRPFEDSVQRVEWRVRFGYPRDSPEAHVIQSPAGVTIRLDDDATVIRYDAARLRAPARRLAAPA